MSNIGQGHSLTLAQGHLHIKFRTDFFKETTGPIEAKFHVEPPWDVGMKVCSGGSSHVTNMLKCSKCSEIFSLAQGHLHIKIKTEFLQKPLG